VVCPSGSGQFLRGGTVSARRERAHEEPLHLSVFWLHAQAAVDCSAAVAV
jgi:hypothetical protein